MASNEDSPGRENVRPIRQSGPEVTDHLASIRRTKPAASISDAFKNREMNRLQRKALIQEAEAYVEAGLEALAERLRQKVAVDKETAYVEAQEDLSRLESRLLATNADVKAHNKDQRASRLEEATQDYLKRLKHWQSLDWPPEILDMNVKLLNQDYMKFLRDLFRILSDGEGESAAT